MKEYTKYLKEMDFSGDFKLGGREFKKGEAEMKSQEDAAKLLFDASRAVDLLNILSKGGIEAEIDPGRKNISFKFRGKIYEIIPVG